MYTQTLQCMYTYVCKVWAIIGKKRGTRYDQCLHAGFHEHMIVHIVASAAPSRARRHFAGSTAPHWRRRPRPCSCFTGATPQTCAGWQCQCTLRPNCLSRACACAPTTSSVSNHSTSEPCAAPEDPPPHPIKMGQAGLVVPPLAPTAY